GRYDRAFGAGCSNPGFCAGRACRCVCSREVASPWQARSWINAPESIESTRDKQELARSRGSPAAPPDLEIVDSHLFSLKSHSGISFAFHHSAKVAKENRMFPSWKFMIGFACLTALSFSKNASSQDRVSTPSLESGDQAQHQIAPGDFAAVDAGVLQELSAL